MINRRYRIGSQAHVDFVDSALYAAISKAKALGKALDQLQDHTNHTALADSVNEMWLASDKQT